MFRQSRRWIPSSVRVEGSVESAAPIWVMQAMRGRQWIDLASGPMATRQLAESVAARLNDSDPETWDRFIDRELRHVLDGAWG